MPFHDYLKVDREKEKRLYHICRDLVDHGHTAVENIDEDWMSLSRSFGKKIKPLVDEKLMWPLGRTNNYRANSIALIQVPKNVKVTEKKGNKKSFFLFRRPKKI